MISFNLLNILSLWTIEVKSLGQPLYYYLFLKEVYEWELLILPIFATWTCLVMIIYIPKTEEKSYVKSLWLVCNNNKGTRFFFNIFSVMKFWYFLMQTFTRWHTDCHSWSIDHFQLVFSLFSFILNSISEFHSCWVVSYGC